MNRLSDQGIGEMQLTAAREGAMESHTLARLTWLATIFIPLIFVSGLFSMNENIRSLNSECHKS
jgi:Mg2+ and Co2+ transporter CorA